MKARISMITFGVRDMEAAVAFDETGLGLPRIESPPTVAFIPLHGSWLGLYGWEELAEDALMAQVHAAGATQVKKPQSVFWGGYSGYFQDLDAHLWEIAYHPHLWIGPKEGSA